MIRDNPSAIIQEQSTTISTSVVELTTSSTSDMVEILVALQAPALNSLMRSASSRASAVTPA